MIVKNEEHILARCLESVACIMDEINIVDTGSSDKTVEIAESYGCKVHHFKWQDDFSLARNYAFSKATMDYVMWLDADDYINPINQEKLRQFKKELTGEAKAYSMLYDFIIDEDSVFSFRRIRIVKREGYHYVWEGVVHEYLKVDAETVNTDVHVIHRPAKRDNSHHDRNLKIYENKIKNGQPLSFRDQYYYGRELYDNGMYDKCITILQEFLDSKGGWVEDNINAYRLIGHCYCHQNDVTLGRGYYFKSFELDRPRAEICCDLGFTYMHEKNYNQAIFWFNLAATLDPPDTDWGFRESRAWTWLPHIQLCVCYYEQGSLQKAEEENEKAKDYCPNNKYVKANDAFFQSRRNKDDTE